MDGALKPGEVLVQVPSQCGVACGDFGGDPWPVRAGNQFSKRNCASGPLKHYAEPQREGS